MLKKIAEAYAENSQIYNGAIFAFLIAVLTHRRGSCMDRIVGGILCGLFSTGLYYGIVSIFPTVPQCAAVAIGSFVGFVGVDECKRIILEKIKTVLNAGSGSHAGEDEKNNR